MLTWRYNRGLNINCRQCQKKTTHLLATETGLWLRDTLSEPSTIPRGLNASDGTRRGYAEGHRLWVLLPGHTCCYRPSDPLKYAWACLPEAGGEMRPNLTGVQDAPTENHGRNLAEGSAVFRWLGIKIMIDPLFPLFYLMSLSAGCEWADGLNN